MVVTCQNEDAEVHYSLQYRKINSIFLCPNFMNDSQRYVQPITSVDASRLKSMNKGTLYLAMVKTGLNEIYTVTIGIERDNEGYDCWNNFLSHLRKSCPLLVMEHPVPAHSVHGYFTFIFLIEIKV
jgi:hypothetical protein